MMHAGQLEVSIQTVRELVDQQFPQWRGLVIGTVATLGTVNSIFRLGDQLAARFPMEPTEPGLARQRLESESRASKELLGRTRFATPEVVAIGEPGAGYPLPWSVQTWLPGVVAVDEDPAESVAFARDLAEFVGGVRAISTGGRTFNGTNRGGDLKSHDSWMQTCFEESKDLLDVPRLRWIWSVLRELPRTAPDLMTHGDLIPGNVLVSDGRLTGILDVGGLGPADPALDLVAAWHLLDAGPRQAFRAELGDDDLQWERGQAWAFEQAMGLVWYYVDSNPAMSRIGRVTLDRICASQQGQTRPDP
jgi:aminoglycoside phosphotransferase (APT) family kinase protein